MRQESHSRWPRLVPLATEIWGCSALVFRRQAATLWRRILLLSRRPRKRLRLCESLPLGERRFVAVVEFDQSRFLVGGTPSSLVLLSRLENTGEAGEAPKNVSAAQEKRRGEIC